MKTKDGRECQHDEEYDLEECEICQVVDAEESAYWLAYFGGPAGIKARIADEKFQREEFDGRLYEELSPVERYEADRRQKG